ncbi:AMP-binding protein [Streptomyces sp. WMMC897]|uniref:AMP-binding protein n=1 Tax=Streptomyces sp. WMMC897 TaxID=3014782 RepID=UPI0022B70EBD|nr:AMP-binding protein [Streptomyces sp. WMMC897]MCZ7415129.1 AMP-binding protein [Streptomyces sp. WMMC897]
MDEPTLHSSLDKVVADHGEVTVDFPAERTALSLNDLSTRSRRIAARLRGLGIREGDRVGALSTNEPDFLLLFFALSRLGACVCPLPMNTREAETAKLVSVLDDAGIKDVLVSGRLAPMLPFIEEAVPGRRVLGAADVLTDGEGDAQVDGVEVDADREIVLQYTSGSTSYPKGVRLTHANVLACLRAIRDGIRLTPADRNSSWLPLFHDMGLFGTLTGILTGVPCTIWRPSAFVKDPAGWLRQFADGGYTISPMPNFAYDYLVDAVPAEEAASYDLSRWRVAFNGAEPIAVDSLEAFLRRFAPARFDPRTMLTVYGLAEATLAVTFPPLEREPRWDWVDRAALAERGAAVPVERTAPGARGVVGVGSPVLGMRLRVADAEGRAVAGDRVVGEVQLRGPSVTAGYVDDAGTLDQPFTADGWLRTGDLGYLAGGELYITGRGKEMLILRGTNFYPDDVESAVRTDEAVHRRRCVAFVHQADEGDRHDEYMVLVAETSRPEAEHPELAARLRHRVRSALGLDELRVVLAAPDSLPRTTSGKLQRLTAKRAFADDQAERGN